MDKRIQQIINKEGLSQAQFADKVGVSTSTISHWINGKRTPGSDEARKILEAFDNISSDWLILGREPMYRTPQKLLFEQETTAKQPEENAKTEPQKPQKEEKKQETMPPKEPELQPIFTIDKAVTRIIVYYSDKTFADFKEV